MFKGSSSLSPPEETFGRAYRIIAERDQHGYALYGPTPQEIKIGEAAAR
jgi:hypothetical protein